MKLMVRELFNEKTGNKMAAELAAGWKAASEYLRKSFKVFTNPNFQVDKKTEAYANAVKFIEKLKSPRF